MVFKDLDLKINDNFATTIINDKEVKVFEYLPIEDKMDLINITLQNSEENGFYNPMKIEMYFNLYLVEMYTDLEFTEEEKLNPYETYNKLESNNVIISVIGAMTDEEYSFLQEFLKQTKKEKENYKRSFLGIFENFIQDMPKQAEAVSEIVNNFDPEKFKEVIAFAQAANGGREIQ